MTSPVYYQGCAGDFYFSTHAINVTKWNFKDSQATTDVKNKQSGGFAYPIGCARAGEISFEFFFNNVIHGSPGSTPIVVGDTGAFALDADNSGGPSITGLNCVVTEINYDHDMAPAVLKCTGTALTQGTYDILGQTVLS